MIYFRTFIVVIFLVIVTCEQKDKSDSQEVNKSLDELEIEQLSQLTLKDSLDNEIFLGFQFGWTESDYKKHLKTLYKQNKLILDNNRLVYEMIIDSSYDSFSMLNYSVPFVIRPSFDENSELYDLELIGNSESLKKYPYACFEAELKIKDLYSQKYGEPLYEDGSTEYVDKYSYNTFYWFSGRRKILLEYVGRVNNIRISYLDVIRWNQWKIEFHNKRAKGINKTLDEI